LTIEGDALAGRRVLVVEDNFDLAEGMARILEAQGAEIVGPVGTVKRALEVIADDGQIDGAVLDINLRGETVYAIADVLRSKGVPTIFTTGYDKKSVKPGYTDIPCLLKPVRLEHLMHALFG
jgi:CheY-like chemotaxis protein